MGSTGGVYRVNFRFLRVPDPLGVEIMQKKMFFVKKFGLFWPTGTKKNFGLGPKKKTKIGPNGPSRVLGAIFGRSGTFSDPIGALSGS